MERQIAIAKSALNKTCYVLHITTKTQPGGGNDVIHKGSL